MAKTKGDTPGDLGVEALLNTLAKTLVEAKVKKLDDTLGDIDCKALMDTTADTLP